MVLPQKDLSSVLVSRVDSPECKLWVKHFTLITNIFSAPTSRILNLHRRHRKRTRMHKILMLWECATVVVRVDTTLTGVQGSRQIRL
jgi:hypothetical protein